MKYNILLAIFPLILAFTGFSQSVVESKVLDAATGKPLPGATVTLNGREVTATNAAGFFRFTCPDKIDLQISFIGYQPYILKSANCSIPAEIGLLPLQNSGLNDVEITATSSQNKSLLYQPASIAILGKKEMYRGQGLFLDDAININIPGVSMNRRSVSAGQQFNIRGYGNGVRGTNGANSNFDGQGYKVYLNGIPITDAEGITLMDDIDFNSMGKVEVLKGPAGTLYGLAIAGAVNLHTLTPEPGKTTIGQDILVGNYGLQRFTTHFEAATEKSSVLLNYGYQQSDGFMLHNASEKRFVNATGNFVVSPKQSVSFYAAYANSYDQRGGELTITQYQQKDYTGNPDYIKRDAHSNVVGFRAGINHRYQFNSHLSNNTVIYGSGQTQNVSSAGGWTDKDPINIGVRSTFETKFTLKDDITLSGITGVEAQRQNAQTIGYNMVPNPNNPAGYYIIGAAKSNQFTKSSTTSVFTEWTLAFAEDLSISAGLGLSHMYINLEDRFYVANSTKPTRFAKDYNGMVSPHVAINKVFSKAISAYASFSKGYKAPVSAYFFIPSTGQLNTNLKAEKANQFEIGTKGLLVDDKLDYSAALFSTRYTDKMSAVAVPLNSNTTAYTYIANTGSQNHKGLEAMIGYKLISGKSGFLTLLRPFANLTLSDFNYDHFVFQKLNGTGTAITETDFSGKQVAGVPKTAFNFGMDLQSAFGIYANLTYSYRDGFPISSDGLNNTSSYNLVNGKIGFSGKLGNHFSMDANVGLNNITGVQYPIMVFVNQLPDAYVPAPLNANYFAGLSVRYSW